MIGALFMTFAEFEKAGPRELRESARGCFEKANSYSDSWDGRAPHLIEAQFYLAEIDRRESAKIVRRDFRTELIIIFLIGLELIIAGW